MPLSYKTDAIKAADKIKLRQLLDALNASPMALRLDDCEAWTIIGKHGTIRTYGDDEGDGYQILVDYETSMAQTYAEKRIAFCSRPPFGNGLLLTHLPTPEQAKAIRKSVGIRKRQPPPAVGIQERLHAA